MKVRSADAPRTCHGSVQAPGVHDHDSSSCSLWSRPSTSTAFSVDPVPSVHLPPSCSATSVSPTNPGAEAPVPGELTRPVAAPVVEHGPRPLADVVRHAVDLQPSGCGPSDVLDRVLERPGVPGHHDTQPLASRRQRDVDVEPYPVRPRAQPRPVRLLVEPQPDPAGRCGGRSAPERSRQPGAHRERRDDDGVDLLTGRAIQHPDLREACVVERRDGQPDDVRRA